MELSRRVAHVWKQAHDDGLAEDGHQNETQRREESSQVVLQDGEVVCRYLTPVIKCRANSREHTVCEHAEKAQVEGLQGKHNAQSPTAVCHRTVTFANKSGSECLHD